MSHLAFDTVGSDVVKMILVIAISTTMSSIKILFLALL